MTTQQAAVTDFNWQEMADTIAMPNHAIINGDNVSARSGRTQPVVNPATAESLTEVADCGPEDADIAVKVARDTFESGVWSAMAPGDRKRVLLRCGNIRCKLA